MILKLEFCNNITFISVGNFKQLVQNVKFVRFTKYY